MLTMAGDLNAYGILGKADELSAHLILTKCMHTIGKAHNLSALGMLTEFSRYACTRSEPKLGSTTIELATNATEWTKRNLHHQFEIETNISVLGHSRDSLALSI